MSEFIDEIKQLRAVTQTAYDRACDRAYYGREEGNQYLSWNEAYHRTLRPTAQRVLELIKTFPSEATFEKKKIAIKIAIGITRKALVAAHAGKNVEHEEMVKAKTNEEMRGKRELDSAILTFEGQLEQDLEDAGNYFQKSPEEMRECLAGHQFVNQWNQEALERLQTLLNEAQRGQGIERQKVRTLLGWIRPEKEVLPSQEEINVALQQLQVIDHAVTTCEQALALAELFNPSMSGNKFSRRRKCMNISRNTKYSTFSNPSSFNGSSLNSNGSVYRKHCWVSSW